MQSGSKSKWASGPRAGWGWLTGSDGQVARSLRRQFGSLPSPLVRGSWWPALCMGSPEPGQQSLEATTASRSRREGAGPAPDITTDLRQGHRQASSRARKGHGAPAWAPRSRRFPRLRPCVRIVPTDPEHSSGLSGVRLALSRVTAISGVGTCVFPGEGIPGLFFTPDFVPLGVLPSPISVLLCLFPL